jgi:hypothetical protein
MYDRTLPPQLFGIERQVVHEPSPPGATQMTNWVMVPVPAEYELPVLERVLVLGMASSGKPAWSRERIAQHLQALEPDARALAYAVAHGVVAGRPLEDAVLAKRLGMSAREVLGLAQEVNDVTVEPFPGVILSVKYEKGEGDGAGYRRLLAMNALVAAAVCELADAQQPPSGDGVDGDQ